MKSQDELKHIAAAMAVDMVEPGMVLGVGTGSTVAHFIDILGERNREQALNLKAIVTTSSRSAAQLEENGFTVSPLSEVEQVDLTVDGADRVDPDLDGIKGGGGALTLEKNVAVNSKVNVWIVDDSKVVDELGTFPLPVEVLPVSAEQNFRRFKEFGWQPQWRLSENGERYKTHYGNEIIDLGISPLPDPYMMATLLDTTVGVVEHGLFLGITDTVIIAREDGRIETMTRPVE